MKRLLFLVARLCAVVIFLLTSSNAFAQGPNLVPNPGFSDHNGVPRPATTGSYPYKNSPQGLHSILRGDSLLQYARSGDYLDTGGTGVATFVRYWFRGNLGTSDYYHRKAIKPISGSGYDSTEGVSIPHNWGTGGLETSTPGDSAYAGIFIIRDVNAAGHADGWKDVHEYLATRLTDTLTPNQQYMVKFKYATAEYKTTEAHHQFGELNAN